ncbi:unnamed protein product, partial [Ixodes hexagonus]
DGNEAVPHGAVSLAFVLDVTGSMHDDLAQVADGLKRILDVTLSRKDALFYNYVLVPFHDPVVGPAYVTRDPLEFQQRLQNLTVSGGGDCPEMALTAVREALRLSLPSSHLYVFTDASSKDFHLLDEVSALVQRKGSQVVFVMTGDCGNTSHPGYQAFEKIATASSGQVFHLNKSDVNQVLDFVKLSIRPRNVNLVSIDAPAWTEQVLELNVDTTIVEFTVSMAGNSPRLAVVDPHGRVLEHGAELSAVLDLENALVLRVLRPTAGRWLLRASSNGSHSIRATGVSEAQFTHGFSREPTDTLSETHHRPLKGVPTYLLVNGTRRAVFTELQLLSVQGETLAEVPLHPVSDKPTLFNSSSFVPPDDFFYLKVVGTDREGFPVNRITQTAIKAQQPDAPEVETESVVQVPAAGNASLRCHVRSQVPFVAHWLKDGLPLSGPKKFRQTSEYPLHLGRATTKDAGLYVCSASNEVGVTSATTSVTPARLMPYLCRISGLSSSSETGAVVTCRVKTRVKSRRHLDTPGVRFRLLVAANRNGLDVAPKGTRVIRHVTIGGSGWSGCGVVSYQRKRRASRFLLSFPVPPDISGFPDENIHAVQGQEVSLECQASGVPIPELAFFRNGRLLESLGLGGGRRELRIASVRTSDAGSYVCRASNEADVAEKTFQLEVKGVVFVSLSYYIVVKVRSGGAAFLECSVTGTPTPDVSWVRNGVILPDSDPRLRMRLLGLVITKTRPTDAGKYACTAVNDVGTATKDFVVNILGKPICFERRTQCFVLLDSPITLLCPVDGNPTPEVTWLKDDVEQTPRGALGIHITHHGQRFKVDHATEDTTGHYTCKATNELGEVLRNYTVHVRVPPHTPPGVYDHDTFSPLEGGSLSLACNISGNPAPTITWLKDGQPLMPFEFPNLEFLDSGRLLNISSLEIAHSGKYMCIATSKVGSGDLTFLVDVQAPAFIDGSLQDRHQTTMLHQPVTFGCPATGSPPPSIAWFHDGVPVLPSNQGVLMFQDGRLLTLQTVLPSSAGIYTCEATNVIGHASLDYILEVLVPPIIRRKKLTREFWAVEGATVVLRCPADGRPPPTIVWLRGAEVLSPESDSRVAISEEDHSLTLKGVLLGDRKFTCVAGNEAGTAEQDYRLHVMVLPRLEPSVSLTPQVSAVVNRQTTLRCPVVGVPPPAVHWLKEGRQLRSKGDPFVQTEEALQIWGVKVSDKGKYTCVASNDAGTAEKDFHVTVLVPPRIAGPNIVKMDVVENRALTLECHVESVPRAAVYWTRNGLPYESDNLAEGLATSYGSRRLWFPSVRASDRGNYVCVAENEAGLAEKTFQVEVNVPPSIHVPEVAISVGESTPTKLRCQVSGIPSPSIFWMYEDDVLYDNNTRDIAFAENGQIVQIPNAKLEHSGKYTCVATNAAGSAEEQVTLTVLVPPRITKGPSPPPVMLQHPATLECQVDAHPPARIEWTKDGELLEAQALVRALDGGRVLQLVRVTEEMEGAYRCRAANAAGVDDHTLFLSVLDPPKILGSNGTTSEELTVPIGETLTLPCVAAGDPAPLVSWIRDGTRLSSTDPFVRVSGDSTSSQLVLKRVRLEDAGRYICVVTSSAGVAEKHFAVSVTVPASIVKPNVLEDVNVVAGETATLECSVRGLPKPAVRWLKDGQPIFATERQDSRYTFLLGGETLLVQSSCASDSGSYKCEASNPGGSDELVYKLRVIEPPDFGSRQGVTEVSMVRQGDATVIECPFSADERFPTSTRWQWNGKSLAGDLLPPNLALSLNARAIHVVRAQRDNAGRYTCTASNVAGEAHFTTLLEVLIPPSFDIMSKDKIAVLEGGSISLECNPHGVPDPVVSWTRDGNKILVGNPNLALFNVSQSDAGTYSCEAFNEAGAAQADFIIDVLEPPWFNVSAVSPEMTVIEGEEIVLSCPYKGRPEPRTSWYKEGRRVHPGPSVKICNDSLAIALVRSHDSGTYVCAVISEAGTAELSITLTVYVPPQIHQTESSPIKVIEGHPVRLSCESSGVPTPSVKWLRSNGSSAAETSNGRASTENGFFLDFSDGVQMEDRGRYICLAENEAGIEQEELFLDVIAPPSIDQSDWSGVDILAVAGQNTSLRCPASGSPAPEIEWLRDGQSIQRPNTPATAATEEILNILNVQVQDAGEYLCLARNEGGLVDMKYKLEIVVPPYFPEDHPEFPASTLVALANHPFSLTCNIVGVPFPTFTWNRDGIPLPRDTLIIIRANQLHVASAKEHHSGLYHCEASNVAGSAQQSYNVTILVPPRIFASKMPMLKTSVIGKPTVFECPATGFPSPSISWTKDSFALDRCINGTLRIEDTQANDAGTYVCTATNTAGMASQEFVLTVHVPPKIRVFPDTTDAVSGKPLVLECVSDGFPRPNLTWHGPVVAELAHEHGLLRIANVGKEHAGNYTCTAASEAGTDSRATVLNVLTAPTIRKSSEDVVVVAGQPAILWCNTSGDPAPQVTWHKDSMQLQDDSDAFEILPSAVYIYSANLSDSGQYVCTVQNHVGSSQAVRNLDVLDPPVITVFFPEERTVVQGSEVSLVCQAKGHPQPTVYWEHNGILISDQESSLNQRYIFVTGGELKIPVAEAKDAGEYRCTAKNQAGWDTRTTTVTVHVPPTILKEVQEEELTLQRGGQAVLHCKADGFPLPTVSWAREGDPISNPRARIEASGDLIIDSAEEERKGKGSEWHGREMGGRWGEMEEKVGRGPGEKEVKGQRPLSHGHTITRSRELHRVAYGCLVNRSTVLSRRGVQGSKAKHTRTHIHTRERGGKGEGSVGDQGPTVMNARMRVDGGWGEWSHWSSCSATCGQGVQERVRYCDNPSPGPGGRPCVGRSQEIIACSLRECLVHGGWSPWSAWSQCTVSCGGGIRTRSRRCNSPKPALGGKACQGNDVQTDFCNSDTCPVHGGWSDWSAWGECSATCGRRHRRRFRTCSNPEPSHGGRTCVGSDQDVKRCTPRPCPAGSDCSPALLSQKDIALGGEQPLLELRAKPTAFTDNVACPKGYVLRHGICEDLNECFDGDRCQHKCENLRGNYRCTCPPGYRVGTDAYSCQDIDECEEDDVNCGRNHICFNARGGYQCMYAPCPAHYVRDTEGSSCRLSCDEKDAVCEPKAHFADILTFKTAALPSGVTAGRDVVRLSARDHDSALLAHTLFTVLNNNRNVPFDVRVSKGVGIVFATQDLPAGSHYRVTVHATTRDDANKTVLFQTRFFLFVSVSLYPY